MSELIDYQQSSFNAGELSPLIKGREGLEKFKSGLKRCENALVLAHGPVTARGGLRYIGEVKDSSKEVRLVPFEFNEDQAYVLEMGNEYMRVWMDGGQVVTPDSDTVLLLHMNGDSGDIDFVDKSANAHVVSVNGNAQVDTVDPVYTTGDEPGNLLLDGTGDFLSVADHADFVYGTDPLTIDLWFYLDSVVGAQCIYFHKDTTTASKWIALWIDPDTDEIYFAYSEGGLTGQAVFTYSTGFAIDTWYHIALIRGWGGNVNDWMVTINGVACGSAQTANMTLPDYDTDPQVGAANNTFLPDHSPSNIAITAVGNAIVSKTQKKFGNGSMYFDGTGDKFTAPDSAAWDITSQTNLTISFFVRHTDHVGSEGYVCQYEDSNNMWRLYHAHGTGVIFHVRSGGTNVIALTGDEITDTDWHHIAMCKVGNRYGIYLDGVLTAWMLDSSADTFAGILRIAQAFDNAGSALDFSGYLDDLSLIHKNSFGVDPLDWVSDDGNTGHTVIPRAAATGYSIGPLFSIATYKWGTASIDFDGADSNLKVADHADWDILGQTNFTIDLQVKHTDHALSEGYIQHYEDNNNNWALFHSHGQGIRFKVATGGSLIIDTGFGGEITDTNWHHIALCKVGNEYGVYLDGTQVLHVSDASTDNYVGSLLIARYTDIAAASHYYDGNIDELRLTHANDFGAAPVAGLTDTITVPTGEHTSDTDTKLLLHFNHTVLTVPTSKYVADSDTKLLLRGDVMDIAGGIDEARISVETRWTSDFTVNTQEYPGAGGSTPYELTSMPWAEAQVGALKWAGVGDILYVVHPEVAIYKISRTDHDVWTCNIVDWDGPPWKDVNDGATTLTSAVFSVGDDRGLVASAALFTSSHIGTYFRFNSGWGIITAVTDSTNAVWDIKDALTAAGPTADWEMSAWSSVDGYPSCITFFEDRLCLSGAAGEPTKIRLSETGDYENMTVGVADSDPMSYQILSQKYNKILWLVGGKKLFIGTAGAEFWMSGAGTNTPLTPTSVLARRESTIGSQDIQPVTIGSSLMFIQRAGRTVNLWKYEYINDSFEATDLGILAEHLMKDYAISDIQYAQDPDHIAWILRTDGTLLGLTHMVDHDVTGWHKHYTSDGTGAGDIETFAVIPGTSQSVAMDELWVVVKRTINGSTVRYIEMLTPKFGNFALRYAMNIDSCITYNGSPATVFTGIDHLEGEAVNIIADGAVFNTTISGGGFTLAVGSELITNGSFSSDTGWTKGVGWTISGGTASCDGSQAGNSEIYQDPISAFEVGKTYRLTYTISNYGAGTIYPYIGGGQPGTSEKGVLQSSNGTYTDYFTYSNTDYTEFRFQADLNFMGDIDNVSLKEGGASVVTAGLPYTVTIEFMVALLTELIKGVTTAKRKRIVELLIMMYETCQLDYGVNTSNMFDVWDATGLADETLNDEYVKVELDGNPEYEPTLMLKQKYPYPFTLLGIVETIEVEEA